MLQVALGRAREREERKRTSLEKEAVAATKAEQLGRWATLVTSNLYRIPADATTAVVEDWEQGGKEVTLTFDAKIGSPQMEAEKAFAAARKLRAVKITLEGKGSAARRSAGAALRVLSLELPGMWRARAAD